MGEILFEAGPGVMHLITFLLGVMKIVIDDCTIYRLRIEFNKFLLWSVITGQMSCSAYEKHICHRAEKEAMKNF